MKEVRYTGGTLNGTAIAVILIVMILQVADVITTEIGLRHGATEMNPLILRLVAFGGWPFAHTVKLAAVLVACLWIVHNRGSMSLLAGTSAVGSINNLVTLLERMG